MACRSDGGYFGPPVVMGGEELMASKGHGSCSRAPPESLRWNVDWATADKICCFNRHFAERSGYFKTCAAFMSAVEAGGDAPIHFYDTVTGNRLFTAPIGRSYADFVAESAAHGWPSFRDAEVNWEFVRVLPDGEAVSSTGTHLGHNLPDKKGNRYCINLVSVAGQPPASL